MINHKAIKDAKHLESVLNELKHLAPSGTINGKTIDEQIEVRRQALAEYKLADAEKEDLIHGDIQQLFENEGFQRLLKAAKVLVRKKRCSFAAAGSMISDSIMVGNAQLIKFDGEYWVKIVGTEEMVMKAKNNLALQEILRLYGDKDS